jgi:branched-chain amino acid transport system substrate-binding protein
MNSRKMVGVATVAVAALALSACGSSDSGGGDSGDATVKIAVLDALTGANQTLGIETQRGTQMAFDKINADGGFKVGDTTYKFEPSVTDIQSDPAVAASTAQKVVSGGTKFILGATTSVLAGPIASAVLRANGKVLMMGPATTLDTYVGKAAPIFRTLPSDASTAKQYIPVLAQQFPDVKQIAGLMPNDPVGKGILSLYLPEFAKAGMATASQGTFAADDANLLPIVQQSSPNAQALFVGYVDNQVASIVRATVEAGRAKILFTRGTLCQQGIQNAKDITALTCIIYTADPLNTGNDTKAAQFFTDYKAKFNATPTSNSAGALYYYDYVSLLVKAMQKAGTTTDVPKIQAALKGLSYTGVLDVGFDANGLNNSPIKVGIEKDGKYTVLPGQPAS